MARDFNQVTLTGRATRDTEIKYSEGGMAYGTVSFVCTTVEKRGDKYEEKPMYLDVKVFGKTAEIAAEYVTKGKAILVSGELVLDMWEKDGVKHSKHILKCNTLNLLGSAPQASESESNTEKPAKPKAKKAAEATPDNGDEIPF